MKKKLTRQQVLVYRRRVQEILSPLFHGDGTARDVIKSWIIPISTTRKYTPLDAFPDMRFFLDQKSDRAFVPVAHAIKDIKVYDRVSIDGDRWDRTLAAYREMFKRRRSDVTLTIGPFGLAAL